MNKIKTLGKKITLLVTLLVTITVASITAVSFFRNRKTVQDYYATNVKQYNKQFAEELSNKFINLEREVNIFCNKPTIFTKPFLDLRSSYNNPELEDQRKNLFKYFKEEIFQSLAQQIEIADIYLLDTEKSEPLIIFQNSRRTEIKEAIKFKNIDNDAVNTHAKKTHINNLVQEYGNYYTYVTYPIHSEKQNFVGLVVLKIDLGIVSKNVELNDQYLDESIVTNNILKIEKNDIFSIYSDTTSNKDLETTDRIHEKVKENWMKADYLSSKFRANKLTHIASWSYKPELGIALLSTVRIGKTQYNHGNFNFITLLIGLGIIIVSYLLSTIFSRMLVYPIIKLKKILNLIGKGVLPKEIKTQLHDEVGDMTRTVNKIVSSLKNTAFFAQQIGREEFDTTFKPISNQDILGNALVEMKDSLQMASSKDEVRNWIIEGLAEIGTILRNYNSIKEISDEVIQFICLRVDSLQGAIFIVDEGSDSEPVINLKSTYAFGKKKNLKRKFKLGEGLVGQAAVEKSIILRSEVPENYTIITSGLLGDQRPNHLLIVPLIYDDKVYGVIELASFQMFNSDVTEFMEEVGKIISRTIFNLRVNENTKRLLEESQRLGSELGENKAQLERNAVEMANTQVILTETNSKLQVQISKVKEAQERQNSLLENASEVIFIFNEQGIVNYVSPSVTKILGYEERDVLGSAEIIRIKEENKKRFERFLNKIIDDPQGKSSIQYKYYKKNGDLVWLEAVGINQLNNPAIKGVVVNVTDITIKRQAEEEQRKRSQMQSLSENSTDIIMRIGVDKSVFYSNPVVSKYTGLSVETLLKKTIDKTVMNEKTNGAYVDLLEDVTKTQETQSVEVDFKGNEDKIFQIQGIPEFDTQGELESVLMISHDVTDEKLIEREVVEKNKQIEDSIYYAENIQEALLPSAKELSKAIPESFILFKPRDIVSGDFPWYKEHNGYLYLAAVDCTGHGVPGAMISLVGYFLLNNILRDDKSPTPAEVLNELNDLVTSTFKQNNENSKLKDGMDMVLCRIDLDNNRLEFASANRPIYVYDDKAILKEIKGDKFPIGGGKAYSNKHPFINHEVTITKGLGAYFFSDGLQDQFNEDSTKKLGTKVIKEIIAKNHTEAINSVHTGLENAFLDWKKKGQQTDDILFIGLKF